MCLLLPSSGPSTHPVQVGHKTRILLHLPLLSMLSLPKEKNKHLFTKQTPLSKLLLQNTLVGTFPGHSDRTAKFYYSFEHFSKMISWFLSVVKILPKKVQEYGWSSSAYLKWPFTIYSPPHTDLNTPHLSWFPSPSSLALCAPLFSE